MQLHCVSRWNVYTFHVRSYAKYLGLLIAPNDPLMQGKIRLTADVVYEKKSIIYVKQFFVLVQCNLSKWPVKIGVRISSANKIYEMVCGIQ